MVFPGTFTADTQYNYVQYCPADPDERTVVTQASGIL